MRRPYNREDSENMEIGMREDQATQTEDEEEDSPKKFLPNKRSNYRQFVRSNEELSPHDQEPQPHRSHTNYWDFIEKPGLSKSASLRQPGKKTNSVSSGNVRNGSSQQINRSDSTEIVPIFHKLVEDRTKTNSRTKNSFVGGLSCPDMLSVECDIVEYL